MSRTDIILEPQVTEKTAAHLAQGKYVFYVLPNANSIEVRRAIEKRYDVQVLKVNLVKVPSKVRRRGRIVGKTAQRKKAIVTLKSGQEITEVRDLF